jgi:hypothetical protein
MRLFASAVLAAAAVAGVAAPLSAQPIAYQGRFTDNGQAPEGNYQIRFTVHTAPTGVNPIGPSLTRSLTISEAENGVFSFHDLDFGPGVFTGPGRWMQVEVSRNGEPFTALSPRQPLSATPHSIFAHTSGTTLQDAFLNGPTITNHTIGPVRVTGNLQLGNPTTNGALQLFQSGSDTAVVQLFNLGGLGGSIRVRDELGANIAQLEADPQGVGSLLRVAGDGGELYFDADLDAGANSGSRLSLIGPASSFVFDTSVSGDGAVVLPARSVGPDELVTTTGLASDFRNTGVALASSPSTIISRSITAPGPGYVVVIATCNIGVQRASNLDGILLLAVSDEPGLLPGSTRTVLRMPRSALTFGQYDFPGTSHGVFEVTEPGAFTFYLNGQSTNFASPTISNANLTLLFVPTGLGAVTPTLLDAPSGTDYPPGLPMSREQILAEQLAEQQRALHELRAEQARLKAQIDEIRARSDR